MLGMVSPWPTAEIVVLKSKYACTVKRGRSYGGVTLGVVGVVLLMSSPLAMLAVVVVFVAVTRLDYGPLPTATGSFLGKLEILRTNRDGEFCSETDTENLLI